MIDALAEAQRLASGPPHDLVTCQKCGYTRRIRRIPQFNAPGLPGVDEGCPECAKVIPGAFGGLGFGICEVDL